MVGPFLVDAGDFDGTSDYATRVGGLTNAADSSMFTFVMWTKADAVGTSRYFRNATTLAGATSRLTVHQQSGVFLIQGNTPSVNILNISTTAAPSTTVWQCLMCSVDMNNAAKRHLYIGDTDELNVTTYDAGSFDFTVADWAVGAVPDGSNKLNGGIAELLFWTGAYTDLSVTANRRRFFSSAGKPVNPAVAIGALGVPDVYFHLGKGEAANNFVANDDQGADGGAFTVVGALSTYASSPSD